MLSAFLEATTALLTWPNPLFVLLGVVIGMVFGAIPGLGGVVALALLIPITFGMDTVPAVILFAATLGGVAFGGSISAILINTPGTAPNAATLFDGYPLAKQGRATEALAVSATASALGALFGLVILILLIPVARQVILAFGLPEFFWLAVLGLIMIAVAGRGHVLKSIIAGGFGLMLTFIGRSEITAEYRYGFGTEYLWDGIQLVPALIGLFAIAEVMRLAVQGGTIAKGEQASGSGGIVRGIKHVTSRPKLFLQSASIGTLTGLVPGVGGAVANFVSYLYAQQLSDDPGSFGTGNVEGVIASEAANDAKDGGALLPTVVFGIPGSSAMVVLLGGLVLHGLNPGQELLTDNLSFLFLIIVALLAANVLTSVLGLASARHLSKLTQVPVSLLIPVILLVSLVGSFALRSSMGDVVLTIAFGLLGYVMIEFNYSRVALVLALVLGPIAEQAFLQSLLVSDRGYWIFVTRPISLALLVIIILTLLLPIIRAYFQNGGKKHVST